MELFTRLWIKKTVSCVPSKKYMMASGMSLILKKPTNKWSICCHWTTRTSLSSVTSILATSCRTCTWSWSSWTATSQPPSGISFFYLEGKDSIALTSLSYSARSALLFTICTVEILSIEISSPPMYWSAKVVKLRYVISATPGSSIGIQRNFPKTVPLDGIKLLSFWLIFKIMARKSIFGD